MRCSVIIPAWNEAPHLPRAMEAARAALRDCEIIVAFAESTDGTGAVAASHAGRVVSCARRQRASQMNEGARDATGDVLLFLHADTLLAPRAGEALGNVFRSSSVVGGGFARRFDSPSRFLQATCLLAEARCRAFGWFLGDQAIFVRARVFEEMEGFRELDRFEDLDFARRLRRTGKVATLRPPVISSARRFAREGPWRRTLRDVALTWSYLRGDPSAIRTGASMPHAA